MGRALALALFTLLLLPGAAAGADPVERRLVSYDGALPLLPGVRIVEDFAFAGVALVEAPLPRLAALSALPGIDGVYREEPLSLLNLDRERTAIRAEPPGGAWPTGEGVAIALVDSGIDATHPALGERVVASVKVSRAGAVPSAGGDADGHGTHVAGIAGGDGSGSLGKRHRGLAPGAKLVGIDISDSFTTTNAVRAFAWIHENRDQHDIRVVSNSWGREKVAHYDPDDPVVRASDALVADGLVLVFSAGNRGKDGASTLTPEAMNPNVISVGGASLAGKAESYSSRGPAIDRDGVALPFVKPDLVAPGTSVVSTRASALAPESPRTDEERWYVAMNGTSMAAPQVAGAAALLLSAHPSLTPQQVHAILVGSARDVGAVGDDHDTGHGMLDVTSALEAARRMLAGSTRVVVERRIDVHHEGTLLAAAGQVLATTKGARVPPDSLVTIPLHAPEGAASVDLWLNWTQTGDISARLVGPTGAKDFQRLASGRSHLYADIVPGAWRVEIRAEGLVTNAAFVLDGSLRVLEEAETPLAEEARAFEGPRAPIDAFSTGATPIEMVQSLGLLPAGLLAGAAAFGAAAVIVWRRRK